MTRQRGHAVWMGQQLAIDKTSRDRAGKQRPAIFLFDLRARQFDELSVFHAGGTRRLARAAIEAAIHVRDERFAELQASLIDEHHLPDSPARRIRLLAPQPVCRAMIQAKAAMHAAGIIFIKRLVRRRKAAQASLGIKLRCVRRNCGARLQPFVLQVLPRSGPGAKMSHGSKTLFNFFI